MKNIFKLIGLAFLGSLILACNDQSKMTDAEEFSTDQQEQSETVILNESQLNEAGIQTGMLEKRPITIWTQATGRVDLPPDEMASVYPRHEGYIRSLNVLVGSPVKKGQVLAWYEHPDLIDMQLDFLKKSDELVYLDSVLRRETALAKEQAVAEKQVQATALAKNKCAIELDAMKQKLDILGIDPETIRKEGPTRQIPLRSGITGFVETVNVHPGVYITPETLCFRVFGNQHQHIELTVFREQLSRMKKGQAVRFRIHGETDQHDGEVFLVAPAIDPESTTASVHVHFDEKLHDLAPGTRIDAEIAIEQDSAFSIHKEELIRIGSQYRLFIEDNDGFRPIWVETGREGDDWMEIIGPPEIFGKKLVIHGNYFLQGSM